MRREAVVVEKDGKLYGQVTRSEACQSCRACQFGAREDLFVPLDGPFREGDQIELEMDGGGFAAASLLSYALPLALLVAGLFVGGALAGVIGAQADFIQAACALLFAAGGVLLIRRLEPWIQKNKRFAPRACAGRGGDAR